MDPIREDLRELKRDLKEELKGLRSDIAGLSTKLENHAAEDTDRESRTVAELGKAATELGVMRSKLNSIELAIDDRQKFIRGWVAGLLALAVAATVGFVIRSSIDVQIARPMPPPAQAVRP